MPLCTKESYCPGKDWDGPIHIGIPAKLALHYLRRKIQREKENSHNETNSKSKT